MKQIAFAVAACLAAGAVAAQTNSTPRVDARQDKQEARIDKGVQSGALNKKEAARLEKGQERVQKMENRAAADGKITPAERAKLEAAQDVQSKRVYTQKHDAQTAKK